MRGRLSAVASACVLAACAGTSSMPGVFSGPNSRTMTLAALNEAVRPGMAPAEVLARIGSPSFTFPVGWQNLSVWNYRFARPEGDCVVFQVSISNATRLVTETGQGYDPACDGPGRF